MKLIIDIAEEDRKDIGNIHFVREDLKFKIGKAIMNGILLDDVKAEINQLPLVLLAGNYHIDKDSVIQILDNIGKAESEDKE